MPCSLALVRVIYSLGFRRNKRASKKIPEAREAEATVGPIRKDAVLG